MHADKRLIYPESGTIRPKIFRTRETNGYQEDSREVSRQGPQQDRGQVHPREIRSKESPCKDRCQRGRDEEGPVASGDLRTRSQVLRRARPRPPRQARRRLAPRRRGTQQVDCEACNPESLKLIRRSGAEQVVTFYGGSGGLQATEFPIERR